MRPWRAAGAAWRGKLRDLPAAWRRGLDVLPAPWLAKLGAMPPWMLLASGIALILLLTGVGVSRRFHPERRPDARVGRRGRHVLADARRSGFPDAGPDRLARGTPRPSATPGILGSGRSRAVRGIAGSIALATGSTNPPVVASPASPAAIAQPTPYVPPSANPNPPSYTPTPTRPPSPTPTLPVYNPPASIRPTSTPTPRAYTPPTATPTPRAHTPPTATPTPRAYVPPTATPTPRAYTPPTPTPTPRANIPPAAGNPPSSRLPTPTRTPVYSSPPDEPAPEPEPTSTPVPTPDPPAGAPTPTAPPPPEPLPAAILPPLGADPGNYRLTYTAQSPDLSAVPQSAYAYIVTWPNYNEDVVNRLRGSLSGGTLTVANGLIRYEAPPGTPVPSPSPSPTATPSASATATGAATPTGTRTGTATATTPTGTPSPTATPTPTPTATPWPGLCKEQAVGAATDWLRRHNLLPSDVDTGRVTCPIPGETVVTFHPSQPNGYTLGHIPGDPAIVVTFGQDGVARELRHRWPESVLPLPQPARLRPAGAAWADARAGAGYVEIDWAAPAGAPSETVFTATAKRVSIGWATGTADDGTVYLVPVYVFEGTVTLDGGARPAPFRHYVPALAEGQ
ncbi:MAG: hypothetical protein M3Q65_20385 [Chloroflexota bacterium]|nr:hypothetical protein [Chloroflexota bacterium]